MEKYDQYCHALGVAPGSSAAQVQESFRDRIKKCHPDSAGQGGDKKQAQLLIEAYSAFKQGVPCLHRGRGQAGPKARGSFWKTTIKSRKGATYAEEKGYYAARRIFDAVFADAAPHTAIRRFFSDLTAAVYPENESDRVWEYNSFREKPPFTMQAAEYYSPEIEDYAYAEIALRETVKKFESFGNRFQRGWARSFINDLLQVQVLYRDISRFTPALSYKALKRIRQISELIAEIRYSA